MDCRVTAAHYYPLQLQFTIGDTRGFGSYTNGGYMHQVKQKKMLTFKSLRQSLADPEFLMSDFAKFDRPLQLHLGFQALHACRARRAAGAVGCRARCRAAVAGQGDAGRRRRRVQRAAAA